MMRLERAEVTAPGGGKPARGAPINLAMNYQSRFAAAPALPQLLQLSHTLKFLKTLQAPAEALLSHPGLLHFSTHL